MCFSGIIKSAALNSFKQREVGIYEVADKLLGIELFQFSTAILWLNALPSKERNRRLKDLKAIKELDKDDTDIYHTNLIDDYYPKRHQDLSNFSLYKIASWFEYKNSKCHDTCYAINNCNGYLHKRGSQKVIKLPYIKPVCSKSLEKYCFQMMLCFVPFRNENELINGFTTYQEALEHAITNNLIQSDDFNAFSARKKKMLDALAKIKELESEPKKDEAIDHEINLNILDLGAAEYVNETVDQAELNDKINNLNTDQKKIFEYISTLLDKQDNKVEHAKMARIFCSGVAGNGRFSRYCSMSNFQNCLTYQNILNAYFRNWQKLFHNLIYFKLR